MRDGGAESMFHATAYDDIALGDTASLTRELTSRDILLFAAMSGDVNPQHMDEAWAKENTRFGGVIAHGLWTGALISTVLGTRFPGPGTIFKRLDMGFRRPVLLGDTVVASVTVTAKGEKNVVTLACLVENQRGEAVLKGEAEVIAPAVAMSVPHPPIPHLAPAG